MGGNGQRVLNEHHKKQHPVVSVQAQDRLPDKQHVLVKWTSGAIRILFPTSHLRVETNSTTFPPAPCSLLGLIGTIIRTSGFGTLWRPSYGVQSGGCVPSKYGSGLIKARNPVGQYLGSGNSEPRPSVRMSDSEGGKKERLLLLGAIGARGMHSVGILTHLVVVMHCCIHPIIRVDPWHL